RVSHSVSLLKSARNTPNQFRSNAKWYAIIARMAPPRSASIAGMRVAATARATAGGSDAPTPFEWGRAFLEDASGFLRLISVAPTRRTGSRSSRRADPAEQACLRCCGCVQRRFLRGGGPEPLPALHRRRGLWFRKCPRRRQR